MSTKINVEKLLAKLSNVSVEQRQEIIEKLTTQVAGAKDAYIAKMEARIAALKSGKSLADLEREEKEAAAAAKQKSGSENGETKKEKKSKKKGEAAPAAEASPAAAQL